MRRVDLFSLPEGRLRISKETNVAYLRVITRPIEPGEAVHTKTMDGYGINVDFDYRGQILGIEFMDWKTASGEKD
jgi:uncharacterized protein YuzE